MSNYGEFRFIEIQENFEQAPRTHTSISEEYNPSFATFVNRFWLFALTENKVQL